MSQSGLAKSAICALIELIAFETFVELSEAEMSAACFTQNGITSNTAEKAAIRENEFWSFRFMADLLFIA
jgi:hypothetical protein